MSDPKQRKKNNTKCAFHPSIHRMERARRCTKTKKAPETFHEIALMMASIFVLLFFTRTTIRCAYE